MVGRRGRPRRVVGEIATPEPIQNNTNDYQRKEISDYEQSREERIQENLQRMQKLGIIDLSLQLKSLKPVPRPKKVFSLRKTAIDFSSVPPSGPTRRSSRLQNVASISYSEVDLSKKDEKLESMVDFLRGEGSRPEVYTEEHEKLLGSTDMSWTLFVDGCGKDGKRIYDPVKGKTCHQCRQKTLGHRTHCSKCGMVQGQFCGDCLYMRYGENVLEANQNPNWTCPVCRGICNCSLCRQSKGWPATGSLYRKISSLGYKSVAHYLVQTRRAEPESEPSSHVEESTNSKNGDKNSDNNHDATIQEEKSKSSDDEQVENTVTDNPVSSELSFDEKDQIFNCCLEQESSPKPLRDTRVNVGQVDNEELGKKGTLGFRQKKKQTILSFSGKEEEEAKMTEVSPDSVAGRLRQRRCKNMME